MKNYIKFYEFLLGDKLSLQEIFILCLVISYDQDKTSNDFYFGNNKTAKDYRMSLSTVEKAFKNLNKNNYIKSIRRSHNSSVRKLVRKFHLVEASYFPVYAVSFQFKDLNLRQIIFLNYMMYRLRFEEDFTCSYKTLSEKLKCSTKTVERDINHLFDLGYIDGWTEKGKENCYGDTVKLITFWAKNKLPLPLFYQKNRLKQL